MQTAKNMDIINEYNLNFLDLDENEKEECD